MPHFGLMDESNMPPHEAALMRARLHLRGGRRRLRQGKVNAGLVTLYDALYHGMRWYALSHEDGEHAKGTAMTEMGEEAALYEKLHELGVTGDGFDFAGFQKAVEHILEGGVLEGGDALLEGYDDLMTRLGVMPFDEGALPPEDPSTF